MKCKTMLVLLCLAMSSFSVQLSKTFQGVGAPVAVLNDTKLFQVFEIDSTTYEFRLYNDDLTLWKTVLVNDKVDFYQSLGANARYFHISTHDFNGDDLVEFGYFRGVSDSQRDFVVITENGTEVFSVTGKNLQRDVSITKVGTKKYLFLGDAALDYSTRTVLAYALDGEATSSLISTPRSVSSDFSVSSSVGNVRVNYTLPDQATSGTLFICTLQGRIVRELSVTETLSNATISTRDLASGVYAIYLKTASSIVAVDKIRVD